MKHKQIISVVIIIALTLSISGCGTSKYKEQYAQNMEHATKAYENLNSAYAVLHNWSHDVCAAWEYSCLCNSCNVPATWTDHLDAVAFLWKLRRCN